MDRRLYMIRIFTDQEGTEGLGKNTGTYLIPSQRQKCPWLLERIDVTISRKELSLLLNQTWLNKKCLLYIYIYIYMQLLFIKMYKY